MNMSFAKTALLVGVLGVMVVAAAPSALAQAPAAPAAPAPSGPAPKPTGPGAVGVNILHLNVANLDQSLAFYRDVLGFEVTNAPVAPRANPGLVNEPGALIRTTIIKQPNGPFSWSWWNGLACR